MISIAAPLAPNTSSVAVPRSLRTVATSVGPTDQVLLSSAATSKGLRTASGIAGGVVGGVGLGVAGAYGGAQTGFLVGLLMPTSPGTTGLAEFLVHMARGAALGEVIGGGLCLALGAAGGAVAALAVYDHYHPETASPATP